MFLFFITIDFILTQNKLLVILLQAGRNLTTTSFEIRLLETGVPRSYYCIVISSYPNPKKITNPLRFHLESSKQKPASCRFFVL